MPPAHVTYGSGRSVSFASLAAAFDADAIKTSIAASASPVTYSGADLNGAVGEDTMDPPRAITITRSSSAGDYTTSAITVTGTYNGQTVTDTLTPADANGGDTIYGDQPFDAITSIDLPAQVNTDGAFTFGTGDIWAGDGKQFRSVKAHAAGNLALYYDAGVTDTLPLAALVIEPVMPRAILASGTTAAGFTVYY